MTERATTSVAPPDREADFVQSLQRGLAVIRAFDGESTMLTLGEVATATGLARAAARRFLLTLVDLGYVRVDARLFEPAADGGTGVHFSVDFAFRSRIFESLAGSMFDRALRRMTSAFEQRAAALYGISKSSAQSAA